MKFRYALATEIVFGSNTVEELGRYCRERGWADGILVADPFFRENGLAEQVVRYAEGALTAVFSDLESNPTVASVDACAKLAEEKGARFIAALGGGSSLDCAKAAAVTAYSGKSVRAFHSGGEKIAAPGLPVVAIPTTAGTGSEVTNVAVLSDPEKGSKAPMASEHMFAKLAIVDPALTLSVPPRVTASTGLDALSHALEGYWSKNHQPICDACAIYACRLVFENLEEAVRHGDNLRAKENMSLAALTAGLAFGPPKTAAAHACSFPLTSLYHIPHGEACAFTLDSLLRINCEAERDRLQRLADMTGFASPEAMADEILRLKRQTGMRCTLRQAGIEPRDLPALAESCMHPNLRNNPVEMTRERLTAMFAALQ
ncbi:MAG: iron-containing alcohol dehydrogenase family protein [Eubacteriales bacterium]|nr:iron-containing alcohol dehydrogenase family protein [Eubacteriales bacterium]